MVRVHYVLWDEIPKCLDQVMESTLGANTDGQTQSSINCWDINTGGQGVVIVSKVNKVSISQRDTNDEMFFWVQCKGREQIRHWYMSSQAHGHGKGCMLASNHIKQQSHTQTHTVWVRGHGHGLNVILSFEQQYRPQSYSGWVKVSLGS